MYYRLHSNPDAPCLCADHAWSGQWGAEFSVDGSQMACTWCQGTGVADVQDCPCRGQDDCRRDGCEGGTLYGAGCLNCQDGWADAQRGYSCCSSPEELLGYMEEHGCGISAADPVAMFEGEWQGHGFDGEDLVVPVGEITWMTWTDLFAQVNA